jgi:LmbE family N-acetylglucosaminyl deacetylase
MSLGPDAAPMTDPEAAAAPLGKLLGVWAHPDDEAYLSAGLMAAAADLGNPATVVTATYGELGFADAEAWPPARAREVRRWESVAALAPLGVQDHRWLDLPDGGLADLDVDEQVARLVAIVEEVQPDTLLTFGPDGGTGHPDHITIGRWATTAARRAARPPRVLHSAVEQGWAERFADLHERFDVFLEPGTPATVPASELAVWLQLSGAALDRKLVAMRAEASQVQPVIDAFGLDAYADWIADEAFIEADPSGTLGA